MCELLVGIVAEVPNAPIRRDGTGERGNARQAWRRLFSTLRLDRKVSLSSSSASRSPVRVELSGIDWVPQIADPIEQVGQLARDQDQARQTVRLYQRVPGHCRKRQGEELPCQRKGIVRLRERPRVARSGAGRSGVFHAATEGPYASSVGPKPAPEPSPARARLNRGVGRAAPVWPLSQILYQTTGNQPTGAAFPMVPCGGVCSPARKRE